MKRKAKGRTFSMSDKNLAGMKDLVEEYLEKSLDSQTRKHYLREEIHRHLQAMGKKYGFSNADLYEEYKNAEKAMKNNQRKP